MVIKNLFKFSHCKAPWLLGVCIENTVDHVWTHLACIFFKGNFEAFFELPHGKSCPTSISSPKPIKELIQNHLMASGSSLFKYFHELGDTNLSIEFNLIDWIGRNLNWEVVWVCYELDVRVELT